MRKLLVLFFLSVGLVADVPIERNRTWNELVLNIKVQDEKLNEIYKFLKEHETDQELYIYDYRFLKALNEAIENNEQMTKRLKELKRHFE